MNNTLERLIRARGIKRAGRLPKPLPPYSVERAYKAQLLHMNKYQQHLVTDWFIPRLRHHVAVNPKARADALGDDVSDDLNTLHVKFYREYTDKEIKAMARRAGISIAEFNKQQQNRVFHRVIGVDIFGAEPWLEDELSMFALSNVQLIKTIPQKFFNELSSITYQGITDGDSWEDIAGKITDRFGVSDWNAERIARDQVGKFNGSLTEERQTDVGVDSYTWRGTMDERERDEHRAHEGEEYQWDSPPVDTGHPGQDILCRCWAEPNLAKFFE